MSQAPPELLRQALAGRYTFEGLLGRGGMAAVYRATDVKHGRPVAVKVFVPELWTTAGRQRFLREIGMVAALSHPHIIPIFDSGEADGVLYYVMPFEEGESLRARLERESPLPVGEAVRVVRDVSEALAHAHARGIVHRDIKPENVLLAEGSAVVADFGIAQAMEDGGARLTSHGVVVGTPTYMSPEQATGERDIGPASDVYSLACVAYEMLVGEPPFRGPTQQAVLARHALAPVPSVHALRPAVPAAVDRVFERALAKSPADRYATAPAFAAVLAEALAAPATAAPRPFRGRWRALGVRARVALVAASVLAAALVATGAALAVRGARDEGPPMLAVLPFENIGDPREEYFADGLTDEVTTRLTRIRALGVISRASAVHYKRSRQPLARIGRELGVQYLLTGTIRIVRSADGAGVVRVTPALIHLPDHRPVWTRQLDAQLAPGEIIRVQAEIAERTADEMDVTVLGDEKRGLEQPPTRDRAAYEDFLRGSAYITEYLAEEPARRAVESFERAVRRDPSFVEAWARLGQSRSTYYFFFDRSPARLAQALDAVNRALALRPDLPEVRLAEAYLDYWVRGEYDRALAEFKRVQRVQPSNAELLWAAGQVQRRQGDWEAAHASFARAVQLSPRSHQYLYDLASTEVALARYPEAMRDFDRTVALKPDWAAPYAGWALSHLAARGDVAAARRTLREGARRVGSRAILAMLVHPLFRARLGEIGDAFADSLEALPLASGVLDTSAFHLAKAEWFRSRGEGARARAHYDSARVVLAARALARPDDPISHGELGMAYAGLGQGAAAVREARRAAALLPTSKDALGGLSWEVNLAHVYTLVGEADSAIATLDRLRRRPAAVTTVVLRTDPRWAPLRAHPQFRALLEPVRPR